MVVRSCRIIREGDVGELFGETSKTKGFNASVKVGVQWVSIRTSVPLKVIHV